MTAKYRTNKQGTYDGELNVFTPNGIKETKIYLGKEIYNWLPSRVTIGTPNSLEDLARASTAWFI